MEWGVTKPLEGYSSLHELSLLHFFKLKILFSSNLLTPLPTHSEALLIFHIQDVDRKQETDFNITESTRWEVDVSQYETFDAFLESMNHKHYHHYSQAEKVFVESGATISRIDGDWSDYADRVHDLYEKVALKHGTKMYDRSFFHLIAKQSQYKLICAWYQDIMIGMNVTLEEPPILHSMCGGLDYEYSTKVYAYSQLNYEFIRWAIELKKFTIANVGITADEAKSSLGYKPVSVRMAVSSPRPMIRSLLRFLSRIVSVTLTPQSKLKFHLLSKKDL